ncbi:MAG: hypothetical protein M1824_003189 [Vezdaea acicularis]|nr:MAG: hypothetical protein M1824_003189 [Vezdaea acicularis]
MEVVTRPVFEPDGASVEATAVQDQASPINNSTAIARFEFEAGRGNEGSKVLMVEWEDDDTTRGKKGDWHVSWEGKKKAVLTVGDESVEETHRVYFFIPPRVHVPPAITLIYRPSNGGEEMRWEVKTLPAIFPPELGASARTAGKKGVLHTIWAKQRLSVLQKEIEAESKNDFDGIGLDLVLKEKAWIEANFGVGNRPSIVIPSGINPASPSSPTSPRSPGGSRLSEKLKGLRLGTSDQALTPRPGNLRQA